MIQAAALCLIVIVSADRQAPVDSLAAPMFADTLTEIELKVFPPESVLMPVSYEVSWGDGETLHWTQWLRSNVDISRYHRYRQVGQYQITVRARDTVYRASDWSTPLPVSVGESPLKWAAPTFEPVVASPTLDLEGNIYVGDESGRFYSVAPDGQFRWSFEAGDAVYATCAVSKDMVYVPSVDSHLYCLDTKGKLRWKLHLGDEFYTAPAIGSDGTVYLGSDSGTVFAVAPNGKLRWRFETGEEISSSPTVGPDGLIYVTADSVYCLDAKGRTRWAFGATEDEYFYGSAVPDLEGTVYAGNTDGFLYAIRPDGRLRWRAPVPDEDEIRPEVVFDTDGTVYLATDGYYLCRKRPEGTVEIVLEAEDILISSPAISSAGTLYFLPDDGYLYALSSSGRIAWRYEVAVGGKDLYYTSSPTIGPDGTVYVGSWDGGLYAFRGDGPPAQTIWPQYRHDAQHTGRMTRPTQ